MSGSTRFFNKIEAYKLEIETNLSKKISDIQVYIIK